MQEGALLICPFCDLRLVLHGHMWEEVREEIERLDTRADFYESQTITPSRANPTADGQVNLNPESLNVLSKGRAGAGASFGKDQKEMVGKNGEVE